MRQAPPLRAGKDSADGAAVPGLIVSQPESDKLQSMQRRQAYKYELRPTGEAAPDPPLRLLVPVRVPVEERRSQAAR